MGVLLRILPYLRPYVLLAVWSAVVTLLAVGVGLLVPWPLKMVIDNVLASEPIPASVERWVSGMSRPTMLAVAVGGGLILSLLANALAVATSYLKTRLEQAVILDFRSDLFHHAERLSVAFRDQISTG